VVLSVLEVVPLDASSGGVTTVVEFFSTRVVVLLVAGGFTTTVEGALGLAGAAGLFTIVVLSVPSGTTAMGVSGERVLK